jgi:hypothetical protein
MGEMQKDTHPSNHYSGAPSSKIMMATQLVSLYFFLKCPYLEMFLKRLSIPGDRL